jgi:hypothetical protein
MPNKKVKVDIYYGIYCIKIMAVLDGKKICKQKDRIYLVVQIIKDTAIAQKFKYIVFYGAEK